MIKSIDEYLNLLKMELSGSDRATIQDALSDAEEHLRTALDNVLETQPGVSEAEVLPPLIEQYGSPKEVAVAYREIETRVQPALARLRHSNGRAFVVRFFDVLADPKAWGALLYLLFSVLTGLLYFTWAIGGLSLSLSMMILIIGVPFTVLFLLSVRGIALVEGRVVEALLGVRMPRRSLFASKNLGWWEQFKTLVIGKHTWLTIVYMLLQLPLGILYFTVFLVLISTSLSFITMPVLGPFFGRPKIYIGDVSYFVPYWLTPLIALGGVALMTATMHLAKYVGRAHGALAKAMLVSD
jgi:uncharacterized membrane protein